ncbi:MAG: universal stress protein [Firmicutes bacterium]|nr:universal stress protein [Bacillota bacterium]
MQRPIIVLATDGSPGALAAAAWVDQHLASQHPLVRIVSVIGVSSFDAEYPLHGLVIDGTWLESETLREAWRRAENRAEDAIQRTLGQLRHCEAVETARLEGASPAKAILDDAKRHHADMIVVGRRGHSRLGTLLGSVSFAIVHASPIPVTVVASYPLWDSSVEPPQTVSHEKG